MSGQWDNPAVPKTGWRCVDIYDSAPDEHGELHRYCDMCEVTPIRYVHVMEHPAWDTIEAGCICAGHMEGDDEAAKRREKEARRRDRFPAHKNWRQTVNGNARLNLDGLCLIVYRHGSRWRVGVAERSEDGETLWGRKTYATEQDARRGAFDALIYAKAHLGIGSRQ